MIEARRFPVIIAPSANSPCGICHSDFEPGENRFSHEGEGGSKHAFHGDCLRAWMDTEIRGNRIPTCPMDRTELDAKFDPDLYLSRMQRIFKRIKNFSNSLGDKVPDLAFRVSNCICAVSLVVAVEGIAHLALSAGSVKTVYDGTLNPVNVVVFGAGAAFAADGLLRMLKEGAKKYKNFVQKRFEENAARIFEQIQLQNGILIEQPAPQIQINLADYPILHADHQMLSTIPLLIKKIEKIRELSEQAGKVLGVLGAAALLGVGIAYEAGSLSEKSSQLLTAEMAKIAGLGVLAGNALVGSENQNLDLAAAALGGGLIHAGWQFVKEQKISTLVGGRVGLGLYALNKDLKQKRVWAALFFATAFILDESLKIFSEGFITNKATLESSAKIVSQIVGTVAGKMILDNLKISKNNQAVIAGLVSVFSALENLEEYLEFPQIVPLLLGCAMYSMESKPPSL